MLTVPRIGFIPEGNKPLNEVFPGDATEWKEALATVQDTLKNDHKAVSAAIVHGLTTTLGRAPYNVDELAAYQAVALSVRHQLIQRWNRTQTEHTQRKPKRIYCE